MLPGSESITVPPEPIHLVSMPNISHQVTAVTAGNKLPATAPPLFAGMGFRRASSTAALADALDAVLSQCPQQALAAIATIDFKATTPALQSLCSQRGLMLISIDSALVRLQPAPATVSAAHRLLGLPGVAEPCALLAAGPGARLIFPKYSLHGVSIALACPLLSA